jgi:hypothetical protein
LTASSFLGALTPKNTRPRKLVMRVPFDVLVLFSLTSQTMAMPLNHCEEYVVRTNSSTLRRANANTTDFHTMSANTTMLTNTSTSTAPNYSQAGLSRDEIEPANYGSLALLFCIAFFIFAMIAIVMFLGLLIATFLEKKCNWKKMKEHRKEKHISKDLEKAEAIMMQKTGD